MMPTEQQQEDSPFFYPAGFTSDHTFNFTPSKEKKDVAACAKVELDDRKDWLTSVGIIVSIGIFFIGLVIIVGINRHTITNLAPIISIFGTLCTSLIAVIGMILKGER